MDVLAGALTSPGAREAPERASCVPGTKEVAFMRPAAGCTYAASPTITPPLHTSHLRSASLERPQVIELKLKQRAKFKSSSPQDLAPGAPRREATSGRSGGGDTQCLDHWLPLGVSDKDSTISGTVPLALKRH